MSIRVKLILTYAILVVVSTVVLIFSGVAIFSKMAVEAGKTITKDNDIEIIVTEVIDLLAEIKQANDYEKEKLFDQEYIKELSEKTEFFTGGLVVRLNKKIYNFSALPKVESFYQLLEISHDTKNFKEQSNHEKNFISYEEKDYFYFDYSYYLDEEEVSYFFVIDLTKSTNIAEKSGGLFLKTITILLLIIITPLIIILTNDIIRPLKELEKGVTHIKNGDLDFKLNTKKKNEIGRVIKYFDVMRGELKKSIDTQIQFEENRKELISSISHDLKTPITSIKGHIEGIRDGVANTPEKLEKYLNVIHKKSLDMDGLIDDLFLFSKLDLNKLPFSMSKVDLNTFLMDIVYEMRLDWEGDNQSINLKTNTDNADVILDPQQMKRVFVNIISNAMKFMDKEMKTIDITLNSNDEYLQIVIADNGQGIDEKHLSNIFNRFYRVDESRNTEQGGTGLGLAISKQIVEQHGGNISVTSRINEGSKFIIELKREQLISTKEEFVINEKNTDS